MYLDGINNGMVCSAEALNRLAVAEEEKKRKEFEEKQRKDLQDKENHDNLDSIAQYSYETVHNLKEIIKLLQEKNARLESQIDATNEILRLLFDVENQSCENQTEQLQQLYVLEGQIIEVLRRGEKVNWKDKMADASVQSIIAVLGSILKTKGIL